MIFKTFDMEQEPSLQGFEEGSYDLILASNVLHATGKLEEMMKNVRRLLKPGGYLITLELTSDDTLRVGMPMGTLPGWWVGAENGRPNGPGMSLPQWDALLRNCGFGGVETSTPPLHQLYVSCIFAAQAVDERVDLLRNPLLSIGALPATDAEQLVIVGGETPTAHRIADQLAVILAARFSRVVRISSFDTIDHEKIVPTSTVVSLTELDRPLFKDITPAKFTALKTLWGQAGTVLWVTRGARDNEPHSFMTVGIGRVMKFEYPNISLQVLDIDKLDEKSAHVIVEELLRLEALKMWEKEGRGNELLWSMEPEVFIESGMRVIPRLYECEQANNRYNSARRTITEEVDIHETSVLFEGQDSSYELQRPSPLRVTNPPPASGETRTIHVSQFLMQTINFPSVGDLWVCVGADKTTGEQLLALSHNSESQVTTLADWTVPLGDQDPNEALAAVSAQITALNILDLTPSGSTLIVHEPDKLVASALTRLSLRRSISAMFTTSLKGKFARGWRHIQGKLPQRLVKKSLPSSPAVFVNLCQASGSSDVGHLIDTSLPQSCARYSHTRFYGTKAGIRPGSSHAQVAEAIKEAWPGAREIIQEVGHTPSIELQNVSSTSILEAPLTVVDCSHSKVSVRAQAIDSGPIFRADKTYFMVGLAGEVGQSLCQWMVEHGARFIVLTSRKPKVCTEFLRSMEAMGATVKVIPL